MYSNRELWTATSEIPKFYYNIIFVKPEITFRFYRTGVKTNIILYFPVVNKRAKSTLLPRRLTVDAQYRLAE